MTTCAAHRPPPAPRARLTLLWRLPPYEDAPEIDIFLVTNPAARLNRAEQYFIEDLMARVAAIPLADREYE